MLVYLDPTTAVTTTEQQPKQLTQILSSHYPVILSLCPFLCYQGSLLLFLSPSLPLSLSLSLSTKSLQAISLFYFRQIALFFRTGGKFYFYSRADYSLSFATFVEVFLIFLNLSDSVALACSLFELCLRGFVSKQILW